jgi:hypothetical protein
MLSTKDNYHSAVLSKTNDEIILERLGLIIHLAETKIFFIEDLFINKRRRKVLCPVFCSERETTFKLNR